jgi:flagellar protein FlaG
MDISSIPQLVAPPGVPSQTLALPPASTDQRALIQAVKAINATGLFGQDNELSFIVDRNSRRVVIRVINRDTREVVRQIPAEYMLRLAEENRGR